MNFIQWKIISELPAGENCVGIGSFLAEWNSVGCYFALAEQDKHWLYQTHVVPLAPGYAIAKQLLHSLLHPCYVFTGLVYFFVRLGALQLAVVPPFVSLAPLHSSAAALTYPLELAGCDILWEPDKRWVNGRNHRHNHRHTCWWTPCIG